MNHVRRTLPTFVHLDADAFFVSVEQALDPSLRGKKVAVGGGVRGIVSSASYEARAAGVWTPMPVAQALRVCPDLIVVSHGAGRYGEFSRKLFDLCETVTPFVERRSIDEGFLDLGPRGHTSADAVIADARALQQRILDELGLPVSFGLAATKICSAIASKLNKPRGFTVVPAGGEAAFLAPLSVGVLPGVGKKTEPLLKANGIARVGDLPVQSESLLAALLGSGWREYVAIARGEDDSQIVTEFAEAKSYSQQETFAHDIGDFETVLRHARQMLGELMPKVRADGKFAKTLTVKVRYPGMIDDTAGRSRAEPSDMEAAFFPLLELLLRTAWRRAGTPVRLVMVKLSGICEPPQQMELPLVFDGQIAEDKERRAAVVAPPVDNERRHRLLAVVDAINAGASKPKVFHPF
jgi:DNA polymerase-4